MKPLPALLLLLAFHSCQSPTKEESPPLSHPVPYDSHVHLMSPELITRWKAMGILFSKPEVHYADIDTILRYNNADSIDLIGMGYVYANPEYYRGADAYEKMKSENDYLFAAAGKYPGRIRPFFAIDPLQDYALEELRRCIALNPEAGLKLHFNASQVYLTEPEHLEKVKRILQVAAEREMPVLLHFDNWHPKFGRPDLEILVDSILSELPPLDLRIAHFGTSGGFDVKTKRFLDAYIELRDEGRIPGRHTVRFDISAVALDKDSEGVSKLTDYEFQELGQYIDKLGVEQIIFGTDYPLYRSEEYVEVLKKRVRMTDVEIGKIMGR